MRSAERRGGVGVAATAHAEEGVVAGGVCEPGGIFSETAREQTQYDFNSNTVLSHAHLSARKNI